MKKAIRILVVLLLLLVGVMAQQATQAIKLPAKQSAEIKDVIQRQAELQRQYRELELVKENILLDTALELGLTKDKLKSLQLAQDKAGDIILVPKPEEKK